MIKVCLLKNISTLGDKGVVVEVSEGYAMNFLFTQKAARRATPQDEQRQVLIAERKAALVETRQRILEYVRNAVAPYMAKNAVKVEVNAMAGGKLYEAIKPEQLVEALQKQFKNLEVLELNEFTFNLPSRLDYTGKYSFDMVVKPKGSEDEAEVSIIVDIVSVSKARRAKRSKEDPSKKPAEKKA